MSPEPEAPKPSSDDAGAPEGLVASASPHIRSPESIPRIMWTVSATLLPAAGWGVYVFGSRALWIMALGIATAVATEAACQLLRRRPVTDDGQVFGQLEQALVVLAARGLAFVSRGNVGPHAVQVGLGIDVPVGHVQPAQGEAHGTAIGMQRRITVPAVP